MDVEVRERCVNTLENANISKEEMLSIQNCIKLDKSAGPDGIFCSFKAKLKLIYYSKLGLHEHYNEVSLKIPLSPHSGDKGLGTLMKNFA